MAKKTRDAATAAPAAPTGHATIEQRLTRGRSARDVAPRRTAGDLAPAAVDRDAVGILIDQGTHRVAEPGAASPPGRSPWTPLGRADQHGGIV